MTRVVCTIGAPPLTIIYDADVTEFSVTIGDYVCRLTQGTINVQEYPGYVNDRAILTLPAEKPDKS